MRRVNVPERATAVTDETDIITTFQEEERGEATIADVITPNQAEGELAELLDSKTFHKDGTRIVYPSARELVEPFLNTLENRWGGMYELSVRKTQSVSNENKDGTTNTAWGRVGLEARVGSPDLTDHALTVGMVYALSGLATPIVIAYHGRITMACLNLMVLADGKVSQFSLLSQQQMFQETLENFTDTLGRDDEKFYRQLELLQTTRWTAPELNRHIGSMFTEAVVNPSSISQVAMAETVRLLNRSDSRYALAPDGSTTAWNVLGAITEHLKDAFVNVRPRSSKLAADLVMKEIRLN
jgi:hypothetical protein